MTKCGVGRSESAALGPCLAALGWLSIPPTSLCPPGLKTCRFSAGTGFTQAMALAVGLQNVDAMGEPVQQRPGQRRPATPGPDLAGLVRVRGDRRLRQLRTSVPGMVRIAARDRQQARTTALAGMPVPRGPSRKSMCRFLVAGEDDETPARAASLHRSGDDAVAPWPGPGDSGGADEANEPRAPRPPRTGGSLSLDLSHPAALFFPNCGDAEALVVAHPPGAVPVGPCSDVKRENSVNAERESRIGGLGELFF